jgi:hypothetical protein
MVFTQNRNSTFEIKKSLEEVELVRPEIFIG